MYKSILLSLCERTNTKTSTSSFKIKGQNQIVALKLIMRCLNSSKEFSLAFSLATSKASFCKTDFATAVIWCTCRACVIWLAFKNESAVPGLVTKESARAVHPDQAKIFPKQMYSDFSVYKPRSMTMKLYSLNSLGHCH